MLEIFINEKTIFDRLFVITSDAVYLANPDVEKLPAIAAQIRDGTPVMTAVPDAKEMVCASILAVQANKHNIFIDISYLDNGKKGSANVSFTDAVTRDAALTAVEQALGTKFKREEIQYSTARAALAPLLTGGLTGCVTWLLCWVAADIAKSGDDIHGRARAKKRLFVWLFEFLGPTGIAIIGGLVLLGCVTWLVTRIKNPPLIIRLTPQK